MKNADMPAMPVCSGTESSAHNGQTYTEYFIDSEGMTKREMFAMHAMQGILSGNSLAELTKMAMDSGLDDAADMIKIMSYTAADKMLEELEK